MQLEGRKVVVIGLGASGVAAARLCRQRGARVVGTDSKPLEELSPTLREDDIEIAAGGHSGIDFDKADVVVVSPGVPPISAVVAAEQAGVEVVGELELAWRFLRAPVLCVGGTNGKSTVTTLAAELLRAEGLSVFCGGNLGTPLSEAAGRDFDWAVVEASSFQLERAPTFCPKVSVLLNITEDHLDRYADFHAYACAKGNAFANQTSTDVAVIPAQDARCQAQASRGQARQIRFGPGGDYAVEDRAVVEGSTGERFDLGVRLFGAHNLSNAAAAIAAVRSQGVGVNSVAQALVRFKPLPHRMTLVGTVGSIRFYDDSKATNVGAAVTALEGLPERRVVLIAGGRDKLGSYAPLADALQRKGRAIVLLGEAADRMAAAVGSCVPVIRARAMNQAVRLAFEAARDGDAVLLSPACSSFDMFRSYADRGDRFAEAVRELEDLGAARGEP